MVGVLMGNLWIALVVRGQEDILIYAAHICDDLKDVDRITHHVWTVLARLITLLKTKDLKIRRGDKVTRVAQVSIG